MAMPAQWEEIQRTGFHSEAHIQQARGEGGGGEGGGGILQQLFERSEETAASRTSGKQSTSERDRARRLHPLRM